MILKYPKHPKKHVTVALLTIFLPLTYAFKNLDIQNAKNIAANQISDGTSISGNYLAGRHAQAVSDMSQASLYFSKALELSPDSQSLLQRTFLVMASEGRIDEALPLAHRVLIQNSRAPVANLNVIAGDIQLNHFVEAMKKLLRFIKKLV